MPSPNENKREALMGYFQAVFVAQDGSMDGEGNPTPFLPVTETPNQRLDQPAAGPFVRVSVQGGTPFNRSVGTTATREVGYFTVEVFMPENTGSKAAREVADLIEANYHNFMLVLPTGRIRFFEVACRDTPSGQDGFGKTNIEVLFWADKNDSGATEALFGDAGNIARGYVVVPPGVAPTPPTTLGLPVVSNVALDAAGNLMLRNSTTSAFQYLSMQGQPGAEVIVALDAYAGQALNIFQDGGGNMMIFNQTTAAYLYPFIRGGAVLASPDWQAAGPNWTRDSQGFLLLRNLTNASFQKVGFQGQPGQQTLQPI